MIGFGRSEPEVPVGVIRVEMPNSHFQLTKKVRESGGHRQQLE